MGHQACKTEHCGAKKGSGAYWGRKADAKRESNRKRRNDGRNIVNPHEAASKSVEGIA